MPAIQNRQQAANRVNGISFNSKDMATTNQQSYDEEAQAIASKKLQLIEEEMIGGDQREKSNGFVKTNNDKLNKRGNNEEIFQDTCAQPMAHSRQQNNNNKNNDNSTEQILIYDGQSNTSIAQTAKDQFAAALLRLQSNLDESTKRLQVVESKVDEFIRQQQKNLAQSKQNTKDKNNASSFFNKGTTTTILYLGWPVLVFLAMRAIERRTLASTAAAAASVASS